MKVIKLLATLIYTYVSYFFLLAGYEISENKIILIQSFLN